MSARASASLRRSVLLRRLSVIARDMHGRNVPNHWSNMFGVVTVACVIVVTISGLFLMFFYTPSGTLVHYHGSYVPLADATVSKAFESTLHISFDVPGGLLLRQVHHWSALLLPAAIIMQLLATFFTGAFRRPRRGSWLLLFLIFIVALVGGWSGYALPDDMLSGTGLRIVEGIVLGIPVVGTWLSAFVFGGEFPGQIIEHLYPIHIVIVPAALIVLIALRAAVGYAHKPPQFAGPGRTEQNVVGLPMLPNAAVRAGGLMLIVTGLLFLVSSLVTISPVWLYGPSSPSDASAGSQPDWYTGFLDGALRLVPPGWEFVWLDRTWTIAVVIPLVVVGVFFTVIALYPFIEAWITGDTREHHILDRPRNTPTRTGIGVAGMTFYAATWGAGSTDLVATHFNLGVEGVIGFFQFLVIAGPVIAFFVTRRVCIGLEKKDRDLLLHGYETGRIVRMPGGEYVEVHKQLDEYERWRLIDVAEYEPLKLRPDERGVVRPTQRLRAVLSRFFFEDRLGPIERQELESPDTEADQLQNTQPDRRPAGVGGTR
jgi:ubiquinol-cytochrome c reductase cytochrome b subunit